jgi:ABC-2 type transport system permease protein
LKAFVQDSVRTPVKACGYTCANACDYACVNTCVNACDYACINACVNKECYTLRMEKIAERFYKPLVLLRQLIKVDFKLRYEASVLGMLWSALKPLLLFVILYVVFVRFLRFGADIPHFEMSLLLGIVMWTFFSEATAAGLRSIVGNGDLLRKISLPKYVIVMIPSVSALINLGINFVVFFVFALINGVVFTPMAILIVPIVLECFVLSFALSLLLSAIYVHFRDICHIWDVVLQGAYFATPIFYPLSMVMSFSEFGAKVLLMNPMAQMIEDARYVLVTTQTETVWNTISNPIIMFVPLFIVILLAVVSVIVFRKTSKFFPELV